MNNKILEYRKKKKMSQVELAEKSDVSRSIISSLENDNNDVVTTTKTLLNIANALEADVNEIFFTD